MKTETFLIAACVLLCHTCSNIGADVEIGILAIPYEINESENTTDLAIYVTLLYGTLNQTVAVELHTANGNAISNIDYENEDNVMLFEVNSTAGATMCSYITILSNNAVQDTKNFTVYLTSNSSGVLIPSYAQSVPVQILGGTTQYIDVSFTSSTYSVRENEGYVHVCIEITSGLLQRAANVYLSSLDGTAFKLTHYSPLQNASLTFLSGDQMNSTRCVNITVFDDMITGSAKFFTVLLTTYDINVHVIAPNTTTITIEESDYVTLSLTKSAYNTSESTGFVTVCAKILNGTLGRSINVYASTIDGTATGVNFIEVQSFPLLFISGKRQNDTSCFNITVIDDMITENTNYFTVYITSNDTGLKLTTPISATVSITDSNYITVRFTSPTITANESSGFAIACVEIMTGYLGRNASIYLSTVDVTAIGTTNYSPLQHREVQFVDEDTENSTACVNIVVYDNMITEDTKYFNVSITAQDTAIILVEPKTCIVGIIDSNYVVVSFTASIFNASESVGYASVCIRLITGTLGRSISIYLSSTNGTATGRDFIAVQSYPLVFTSGKRQNDSTCFNVTVIDDMVTENTNFFTVSITSNDTGVQLATPTHATVSITDSDYITIGFTSATTATNESTGYVTVCIKIQTGILERSANVYVSTMDGTAINSSNYSPRQYAEVQFLNGDRNGTTRCINITVLDNLIVEDAKDFKVYLTTYDSGIHLVSPNTTTVTIVDSDYLMVSFTASAYYSSEKQGYAMICAKIVTGVLGRPIWVYASTVNGTATDRNFIPVQSYPLLFPSGRHQNDSVCFNITVIDDKITGDTNYFAVTLTSNDTAVHLTTPFNTSIFISDSDLEHLIPSSTSRDVQVSLDASTYNSSESMGYVTVCAKIIMGTLGRSASVYVSTMSGTATDRDFIQVNNYTISFVSGNRQNDTSCFNITIIDDMITENTNYFTIYITSNDTGLKLTTPISATVSITDSNYITVRFTSPTITANESSGFAIVCVEIMTGYLERNASIYLSTVDVTAIGTTNYSPLQHREVQFVDEDTENSTACVNIVVYDNMITEDTKYFNVSITAQDTAIILVEPKTCIVGIIDSNYVVVSFTASIFNASESVGYASVCIRLITGTLGRSISIYLSSTNGTATGRDFIAVQSYPLVFTSGKRQNDSTCFNVTVIDDMVTENTNFFTVSITSNDTGVQLATPTHATVSITDSDYITIGFTSATTATNESTGYVTVCIKIQTGILERSANVYVSTMDGTAINSSNYSPRQYAEVQFLNGDRNGTTRCINITVLDNLIVEDAKDFKVYLTTYDSGIHLVSPNTTTVTIVDSDYLMVSFTASAYYSSEKQGYAVICAKIVTGVLGRPIWVYASTVNGTATDRNFIPVQSYPLLFTSGRRQNDSVCFNITVIDDKITGDTNYFAVTLTSNDTAVHLTTPFNTSIFISDSDYVQVSLDASTYNSSESMGYVTVCAKIIMGTLGRSASVYVSTMSGTATDRDFIQVNNYTISFVSGNRQNDTSCFNITIIDDMITENTNYFTIYITSNDIGLKLTTPINATVCIEDNDYIMVGFSSPIYTTNGGAGYVQVCAEILKGTLEKSVSVHLTSTNDTAIIGEDYYSVDVELVFSSGQRQNDTSCANITLLDDMITDGMQKLVVSLHSNIMAVQLAEPWNATVIIDDINYITVSLTSSVYNTSESEGYLDVCAVILSGYLNIPVVVYISTTDGTANDLDFMPVQDLALWFFPDDTQNDTSCTNITILHDLLTETTQNFFVFVYSNDSSVKLVPPTNATIFIADIDSIEVGFNQTMYSGSAHNMIQVCVHIYSGQLNATVNLGTDINGISTAGSAFRPPSINFVLMSGDRNGTIHCEYVSLLPVGVIGTSQKYNVTLLQLTADITVHFKQRSAIIVVYNPASNQLTAEAVAAISTGVLVGIIIIFILILSVYMLVCTSMIKKATVKQYENSLSGLYFPLKPEYANNIKGTPENEMLEMKKLDNSLTIKNETFI